MIIYVPLLILLNFLLLIYHKELSKFINIYDYPNSDRKIHLKKTPTIGGIFIFINCIFIFLIFLFDKNNFNQEYFLNNKTIFSLFIPLLFFFY